MPKKFLFGVIAIVSLSIIALSGLRPFEAATDVEAGGVLPAGWPTTFQIGHSDSPGGAAAMKAVAPYAFRYQYLAAGVNTGNGWANWNANGAFATYYIQDSVANGITPG